MRSLAEILSPYSVEEFLENNWQSKGIYISSAGERKFNPLFSWDKLTYLLNFHEFKYPELRLALDEKVLDESANSNIMKWMQDGATIIINGVHKRVPEIAKFAAEVRKDIGYGVQVNAYCSWPGRQGFSSHYDTHEVFILQIDGRKKWYVFPDTFKYPLQEQKSSDFTTPEGEPYLSCTLEAGDVLYIPRGHWHYAIACDRPSLHLTLGVHCKTGIDFLEWVVNQLKQQEEWRKSIPLRSDKGAANGYINGLVQNLNQYLTDNNISQEYINYLDSLSKPVEKYSLPYQAGFNIFHAGVETRFKTDRFQRVKISELPDGSGYKIIVAGKEVSLRGVPYFLVENLFNQESFTGNDVIGWLPDYDWELDIVPLLSRLVLEGILFVDVN
ncbi:MAG: cupin domain-containing protein [Nostocaceae cyanobacterium]|nr:cupin domain-containing protein [Nostocaceae cyanobacterium]